MNDSECRGPTDGGRVGGTSEYRDHGEAVSARAQSAPESHKQGDDLDAPSVGIGVVSYHTGHIVKAIVGGMHAFR